MTWKAIHIYGVLCDVFMDIYFLILKIVSFSFLLRNTHPVDIIAYHLHVTGPQNFLLLLSNGLVSINQPFPNPSSPSPSSGSGYSNLFRWSLGSFFSLTTKDEWDHRILVFLYLPYFHNTRKWRGFIFLWLSSIPLSIRTTFSTFTSGYTLRWLSIPGCCE